MGGIRIAVDDEAIPFQYVRKHDEQKKSPFLKRVLEIEQREKQHPGESSVHNTHQVCIYQPQHASYDIAQTAVLTSHPNLICFAKYRLLFFFSIPKGDRVSPSRYVLYIYRYKFLFGTQELIRVR